MALGVDIIYGHMDHLADSVTDSLAKAVKDKVDSYTNDSDDVVQMNTVKYGSNQVMVVILHK
jgi:hypothetical protein